MSLITDISQTTTPPLQPSFPSKDKGKQKYSYFHHVGQNDSDLWRNTKKLELLHFNEACTHLDAERVLATTNPSTALKLTHSLSQKQLGRLYKVIHYMDGDAGRAKRAALNPILYHSVPDSYSSPSVQEIHKISLEYLETLKLLDKGVLELLSIPGLANRNHIQALEIINELKTHLSEQLILLNQGVEVPFKPYYLYFQGENTYVSQVFIPPLPNSVRLVADIAIEALNAESILDCECSDSCESCQYKFQLQTPLSDLNSFSIIYSDELLDQEEKALFETIVPKAFQIQTRSRMKSDVAQLKGAIFNAFRTSLIPAQWAVNSFTKIPPPELPSLNQLKELLQQHFPQPCFDLPKFSGPLYSRGEILEKITQKIHHPMEHVVLLFNFLPNVEELKAIFDPLSNQRSLPLMRSALRVWYSQVKNGKSIRYRDLISLKFLLSGLERSNPSIDRSFILTYLPKLIRFLSAKNKESLIEFASSYCPIGKSDAEFIKILKKELPCINTQNGNTSTSSSIQPNKRTKK